MNTDGFVTITGASGFLGGVVAARFLDAGLSVRAVYRRPEAPPSLTRLQGPACELVRADCSDPADAARVAAGSAAVVHMAGAVSDWGPRRRFYRDNILTTRRMLAAASKTGARRFIYISSLAVQGFGPHSNSTEEGPYYPLVNIYQRSKAMAESFVLADRSDMRTIVLRPGNITGPGDTTSMFPLFDALCDGGLPYVAGGRFRTCPVHVGDVAEAVLAAFRVVDAEHQVFNIVDEESVTWRELLTSAAAMLETRPPRLDVPVFLAKSLARILEKLYWGFGSRKGPAITPYRVDQLSHDYTFSPARAKRELGFRQLHGWRAALQAAVQDYRRLRSLVPARRN